jgi:hypothetical protein
MPLMNDQEVAQWSGRRGIDQRGRKLVFTAPYDRWIVVELPSAAAKRLMLAGDLLLLGDADVRVSYLLWISTWKIWNEWSNDLGTFIVTNLRTKTGEVVSLDEKSAQLFDGDERKLPTAIVWQAMLLNWDLFIVPETGAYIVECSHDELVWIMCKTEEVHNQLLDRLAHWKPMTRQLITA